MALNPVEYEIFQARKLNEVNDHINHVITEAARAGISAEATIKRARHVAAYLAYNLQLTLRAASGDTTLVVTHK